MGGRARILLLGLAAFAWALAASAQPNEAQKLFDRGLADMLAKRYATGCPLLAESYQLEAKPGTLFTLAECWSKGGKTATAYARYGDYLLVYEKLPAAQQRVHRERQQIATKERAQLLPHLARITITLPASAPSGTVVIKEGQVLDAQSIGKPMYVDPGEHVFVTQAPGGPRVEQRTTIRRGQNQSIELVVGAGDTPKEPVVLDPTPGDSAEPPPVREDPDRPILDDPDPDPPPDDGPSDGDKPREGGNARRTWGYIIGGFGVAGIVAGSITGALVLKESETIDAGCDSKNVCTPEAWKAVQRARQLGLASTVSFSVGAVGVGIAAVLLLGGSSDEPREADTSVSPTLGFVGDGSPLVGVEGRF
jgi:hypothetical protein